MTHADIPSGGEPPGTEQPKIASPWIERLAADARPEAERLQRWAAMGLPVPPSWRVRREVLAEDTQAVTAALAQVAGNIAARYWVLQQGPATPGSQRESLLNLDSDLALSGALQQVFRRANAPDSVIIQSMPARHAAGVLFTRHPVRPDLEHVVIEGVLEQGHGEPDAAPDEQDEECHEDRHGDRHGEPARLILHRDGAVAWSSENRSLVERIGADAFATLAGQLRKQFERPQACEWIFDGQQLWVVQTLPVGSLPRPTEAWSRRAGFGLWHEAVSPLWYTLAGRWLKTAFWRPLGDQLGWQELANVEPYRRQHSHIYSNSQFFLRLLEAGVPQAQAAIPPAWHPQTSPPPQRYVRKRDGLQPWLAGRRLLKLERELARQAEQLPGLGDTDGLWRALMRLDSIGERLAALEGWLCYVRPPPATSATTPELVLANALPAGHRAALRALGAATDSVAAVLPAAGALGADPMLARFGELPPELGRLRDMTPQRAALLSTLPEPKASDAAAVATGVREQLGTALRQLLQRMAEVLVARGRLVRTEDVFFVYFDELWQLWQPQESTRPGADTVAQRKMRLLNDAWHGAPDWIIDQIAYGARLDQQQRPVLNGSAIVPAPAQGTARVIHGSWALAHIEQGDILVLDQCDTAWLPWLCLAGGLVLAGHAAEQPAALLAQWLGIPCIIGVDDAMHCITTGSTLALNQPAGSICRPAG